MSGQDVWMGRFPVALDWPRRWDIPVCGRVCGVSELDLRLKIASFGAMDLGYYGICAVGLNALLLDTVPALLSCW